MTGGSTICSRTDGYKQLSDGTTNHMKERCVMKRYSVFHSIAVLAVILAVSLPGTAAEKQTVCPVMGGEIDTGMFVDAEGKRIYVCCEGCIEKVKADPATYIAKLEKQGVTLEKAPVAQTTCPVSGKAISLTSFVDVEGKRVYTCCAGCNEKVKVDAATYIAKMKNAGVTIADTPKAQTICPVMGGAINRDLYVDANGKRIYVCCGGCIDKVKADPATYISKLEKEGVTLEKAPE